MKACTILFFALLCLLLPCSQAFCQGNLYSGYVVNLNGDTVKCEFKKPALGQLKYRAVNSADKFKKPSLEIIKEYYSTYDSTVYIAIAADSGSSYLQFLQRLENGTIKLYEQVINTQGTYMNGMWMGGSTNLYYYITKHDSPLKAIKSNTLFTGGSRKSRREYLTSFFSDDATLAEKFKSDDNFDLKTLRHYISTYNADIAAAGNKSK